MTTIPARSLSGDHLGRVIYVSAEGGHLIEVTQRDSHVSMTFGFTSTGYHIRNIAPDHYVTLEDTE